MRDCCDLQKAGAQVSVRGFHRVDVHCPEETNYLSNKVHCSRHVYCDFETDGGGWTVGNEKRKLIVIGARTGTLQVIQQRRDGSMDFRQNWNSYKMGFGNDQEFWIGNEYLHQISLYRLRNAGLQLRIELIDADGQLHVDEWIGFYVSPEKFNYLLLLGIYRGTSKVDNLLRNRGRPFATYDRDQGVFANIKCAAYWQTAWWVHPRCLSEGDLNAPNYDQQLDDQEAVHIEGIFWRTKYGRVRVAASRMMVRPLSYR
ncbi:ficolin 2 [Trichuris trichiura]|uniref:Ficolin 2 n=1 Tax=Trichuris trichiura TaxID=36087 RepID=A0A077Z6R9_TRITR|nr:ficolin 2 [Trichuris trichiura]